MNQQLFRSGVLLDHGALPSEIEELLAYNQNIFDLTNISRVLQSSLPDEAHLPFWRKSLATAEVTGIFETCKNILVQLQLPIQSGISQTKFYREATLKGHKTAEMTQTQGLQLQQPEKLQLEIYPSLAGSIPILFTANRADFVCLVQALTKKNEPEPIPDSMGACMVANYNNWGRINQYRDQWSVKNGDNCAEKDWQLEFRRLIPQKQLYQDRFIILSDGFYSGVTAQEMNLSESEWRSLSLAIRLEHECTHYFTHRVLGSMRNNLLDELIADYQGIVAAIGYYRADWFLRFMGLESFPHYRPGARFENYQGESLLSSGALKVLQRLVKVAAENLEYFDRHYARGRQRHQVLLALTCFTLEELASKEAPCHILKSLERLQENICV
jgi:hypothetical protein